MNRWYLRGAEASIPIETLNKSHNIERWLPIEGSSSIQEIFC